MSGQIPIIGIDVLNVGKGDAIFVELQDGSNGRYVVSIDGGTAAHGTTLVEHASTYFGGRIDLAVCSHPDMDHIEGLTTLIEESQVSHLIINDPRDVASAVDIVAFAKKYLTNEQIAAVKTAFDRIDDLKSSAEKKSTALYSFFANPTSIVSYAGWNLRILGPAKTTFVDLWARGDAVRKWFDSDSELSVAFGEAMGKGLLDDDTVDTSPINNTSIVLLIEGHGQKYLFTGDAGKRALREAARIFDISNLSWLDVPHHGSRRNLDTALLKYLAPDVAFISSPGTTKHPRKAVVKGLQTVGARVYSTCKTKGNLYQFLNLPNRPTYVQATPWEPL